MKRANISWNARQLSKMIEKGTIIFDSAIQRNLVWDDKRKSLLIHSMLEGYPIPPMYAAKENGSYSFLDGKQRCNAINDFLRGKFTLTDIPEVTLEDGTEIDINGMYFSELNEELQDALNTYSFTIYYFEDITEDEISEMFFRLNFGKPLSAIELSRAKAKSLKTIQKIGGHELFKSALTEKAFEKYTHEDLVIKSYIMLTSDTPCLDTKFVRPIMETIELQMMISIFLMQYMIEFFLHIKQLLLILLMRLIKSQRELQRDLLQELICLVLCRLLREVLMKVYLIQCLYFG